MTQLTQNATSSDDPSQWFGVQTPAFTVVTLASYLLIVLLIGPNYMKNRSPYKMKAFIVLYNLCQVLACIRVVRMTIDIATLSVLQFWKCSPHYSNGKDSMLANLSYFLFWQKLSELIETVVFVLRKKQNQVSFLHVFHHVTVVTLAYANHSIYRSGQALYPFFLNSIVHIIMYSYYLSAAVCSPEIMKHFIPIKKSITIIQIIQFVLILIQVFINSFNCQLPTGLTIYYVFVVSVIFYGFYDFYKKSYKKENLKA